MTATYGIHEAGKDVSEELELAPQRSLMVGQVGVFV
jgi:hypothetical protein